MKALLYLLLPLLFLPLNTLATTIPSISDDGHYFILPTLRAAQRYIASIRKEFQIDVFIETFPQIPIDASDSTNKEQHYFDKRIHDWLQDRNNRIGKNSIHFLFIRDPGYVIVSIGTDLISYDQLNGDQRNRLTKIIQSKFERRQFDSGMLEALKYTYDNLHANVRGDALLATNNQNNNYNNFERVANSVIPFFSNWGILLSFVTALVALLLRFSSLLRRNKLNLTDAKV